MLEKEYQYFQDNRESLVKEYKEKYIVIKENSVIGSYDTETEAFVETTKEYEAGTFLIQHCVSEDETQKQVFHSRVTFS